MTSMEGRIAKALSGYYYVDSGAERITCRARGKFRLDGTSPLVGDGWHRKRPGDTAPAELLHPSGGCEY